MYGHIQTEINGTVSICCKYNISIDFCSGLEIQQNFAFATITGSGSHSL